MLGVCLLGIFCERSQLDWPDHASRSFIELWGSLAAPESLDQVLDANDTLASKQFLNHHVVRDWQPRLRLFAVFFFLQESSLANNFVENHLGGLAISDVVPDQQNFVESCSISTHKGDIVDFLQPEFFQDLLSLWRCVS